MYPFNERSASNLRRRASVSATSAPVRAFNECSASNLRRHRVITAFIERLQGAQSRGEGRWVARCPAHEDRTPSLSVREVEDGMIILHCFAGCSAEAIVAAMGLQMANLFQAKRPASMRGPAARLPAREILELIDQEVLLIALTALDLAEQGFLSEEAYERLFIAAARIGQARDYAHAAR